MLILACAILAAGCSGPKHPKTVPAGGSVSYRGAPAAGAQVTFMPGSGRPATATTDSSGKFQLSTIAPGDGALPGTHKVTISKRVPLNDKPYAPERDELPARYGNAATSLITAEVTETGPNEFLFELTDPGK